VFLEVQSRRWDRGACGACRPGFRVTDRDILNDVVLGCERKIPTQASLGCRIRSIRIHFCSITEESCIRRSNNKRKCIVGGVGACKGCRIIYDGAIICASRCEQEVIIRGCGCANVGESNRAKIAGRCGGKCNKPRKIDFICDDLFA